MPDIVIVVITMAALCVVFGLAVRLVHRVSTLEQQTRAAMRRNQPRTSEPEQEPRA